MRFYNPIGPLPAFTDEGAREPGVHDRLDAAQRSAALAFLASHPAILAPARGASMLETVVHHTEDEQQPFYRTLLLTDPSLAPAAVLAFGLVAGSVDAYDFFAIAARDLPWALRACASWCEWLEAAAARVSRVELDSASRPLAAVFEGRGFALSATIADFYGPGEDQLLLTHHRRR